MSRINNALQHKQKQVAKLSRQLALMKIKQRKADTRHKIQLGGLVIKAKLSDYSKAEILGALLSIAQQVREEPESLKLYQQRGEAAFMGYGET